MAPCWPLLVAVALAADPRLQLESIKARKASEEAAARALDHRVGSVLSAMDGAEWSWVRAEAAARAAEGARVAAAQRLAEARASEAEGRARLRTLERDLGPRLRARARLGELPEWRILWSSASLADAVKRRYLWERVTAADLKLLSEGQRVLARHEVARAAIERQAQEVERLEVEAERQQQQARASREEHRALLGALRGERALHERAAQEAAAQEAKLAELVASLPPPQAPVHTGFAHLKGKLPLPVTGTVAVGFGPIVNPRFNTVTVQKGLDVRAPDGGVVRSVAAGRVAHAGWFKGYGNLVIVDHGDGYYTLVAHLASLGTAAGEEVVAGAPLGTVGDSGSLDGPHVYFEIRENGRPVDPREWLRP